MIKINNIYYELNLIDIIKELKEQLAINNTFLFAKIKELPEDLRKSLEEEVQKITDEFVKKIDAEYAEKEKEIMTI